MCLEPNTLKDGSQVACRYCRLCLDNRLNDWVGRGLAEQMYSAGSLAVTLTYKGNGPESAVLRYEDVQLFLKRLRKDYAVRYLCAGEYGSRNGRAHWHLILFFPDAVPSVELERRVDWKYWPHGFSYFQNPDLGGFRYVLKYILKDAGEATQVRHFACSKKPLLGHGFILDLARRTVDAGLPLNSPAYSFSNVNLKDGRSRQFWLQGTARGLLIDEYIKGWLRKYECLPPLTDLVANAMAKANTEYRERQDDRSYVGLSTRSLALNIQRDLSEYREVPDKSFVGLMLLHGGEKGDMVDAYSDETALIYWKGLECQIDASETVAQLLGCNLSHRSALHVAKWLYQKWWPGLSDRAMQSLLAQSGLSIPA